MHDIENKFNNVFRNVDPDWHMAINIPECTIIPGDEVHHRSYSLRDINLHDIKYGKFERELFFA